MPETSATIIKAITIVIITIILLALTPVIVAQVQSLVYGGTTGTLSIAKWNFTGYSGALSMLGLVPFVWVAGVLLAAVIGMLALYRGGKEK